MNKLLSQVADLPRQPALLGHFLLAKKVEGRPPRTLDWYQEALQAFGRFCDSQGSNPDPTQVTPLHIRMWLAHIQETMQGNVCRNRRNVNQLDSKDYAAKAWERLPKIL